jgi:hypothetical protein
VRKGIFQVDKKARTTKPAKSDSPYAIHRGTRVWKVVDKAIDDLVENGDLTETTRREYIVGYICKKLQHLLAKTDA